MASPGIYNITHVAGDTFQLSVTWKDPAGVAIDLTGYTAAMQVRDKPGGTVWASSTGVAPALTITNGLTNGNLLITGTITASAPSMGVYDLQVTSSGNVVDTILAGQFTVIEEVTA
jgi:hypothetical protein